MGLLPDPSQLIEVDAIVHLAWATTDRRINFHTNIGGTIQLANLAKDLGCPFLFISSVGVDSESLYGKSKFLAEKAVNEAGGKVVRLGLFRTANRYLDSKEKIFTIYPNFKNLIPVVEFESFANYFVEWAAERHTSEEIDNGIVTLVDEYCGYRSLTNARIQIPIPEKMIGFALRILEKMNYRFDDIYDGFKTITTRKEVI
jgi:hypothetical protein